MDDILATSYSEIIARNRQLSSELHSKKYRIKVLSNIVTAQLNELLECALRIHDVNADVTSSSYDNILQECAQGRDHDSVILFWELANIAQGFCFKASTYSKEEIDGQVCHLKKQIDYVLRTPSVVPVVLFNRFCDIHMTYSSIDRPMISDVRHELNEYLDRTKPANVILVDIQKVIATAGVRNAFDLRLFHSSRALYTLSLYREYVRYIAPIYLSLNGKMKKVLVVDCDNTLWKGSIGEDGIDSIEMSSRTRDGAIFEEVQYLLLDLYARGALICLCSKNNGQEIDEVLGRHPDMHIREQHIAVKKVNWQDKSTNLLEIARELNVGLDSIVFLDDSDYEVGLVRNSIPEITAIQVPKRIYEYPTVCRSLYGLFHQQQSTQTDRARVQSYRDETERNAARARYTNVDDFLASLKLKMKVFEDQGDVARLAQLTQKTNQFNLTTRRYTEAAIDAIVRSSDGLIFSFDAADMFGDYGTTGLCIMRRSADRKVARIEAFLMSCRVIGRNLEFAFLGHVVTRSTELGIAQLECEYLPTPKNAQVADFYDRSGFRLVKSDPTGKVYKSNPADVKPQTPAYIEVVVCRNKSG